MRAPALLSNSKSYSDVCGFREQVKTAMVIADAERHRSSAAALCLPVKPIETPRPHPAQEVRPTELDPTVTWITILTPGARSPQQSELREEET